MRLGYRFKFSARKRRRIRKIVMPRPVSPIPSNGESSVSISLRSRLLPVGLLGEQRKISLVCSSVAANSLSAENWKFSSNNHLAIFHIVYIGTDLIHTIGRVDSYYIIHTRFTESTNTKSIASSLPFPKKMESGLPF